MRGEVAPKPVLNAWVGLPEKGVINARMRHNSAQAVIQVPADGPLVTVRYDGWCPHLTGNPALLLGLGDIRFRLL